MRVSQQPTANLFSHFFSSLVLGIVIIIVVQIPVVLFKFTVPGLPAAIADRVPFVGAHPVIGYVTSMIVGLLIIAATGIAFRVLAGKATHRLPVLGQILERSEHLEMTLRGFAAGRPVVLLSWPNPDVRTIAILTATTSDVTGRELAVVYIPNTPHPLSGIVRVVDMNQVTMTDMKVGDAMTVAVSRGSVVPGNCGSTRRPRRSRRRTHPPHPTSARRREATSAASLRTTRYSERNP